MIFVRRPQSNAYVAIAVLLVGLVAIGLWFNYDYSVRLRQASQADGSNYEGQLKPSPSSASEPAGVSYDTLFNDQPLDTSGLDPAKLTVVVATGDIIPARGVDAQIRRRGVDYPLSGVGIKEVLSQADIAVANLEAPLLSNCPAHNEGFTFCGQAAFAAAMAKVGIDMVSLENNHIGNYGQAGVNETIDHLSHSQIDYADRYHLAVKEVNGLKFGLIAFNGITGRSILDQDAVAAIAQVKSQVDVLMAAVHWGKEYQLVPTYDPGIAAEDPLAISHALIDAGADMIIGNHPHWVQGVELYKDKLIAYAHGNFIFDQSWSTETSQGVVGRYTYYGKKLIKVEFIPVAIINQAQPNVLRDEQGQNIVDRVKQSTELIRQARP